MNGCTDVTAFNYDALANTDDGSCIAVVNGCTDVTAFNYDALANTDDGSCIAVVNGCTDVTAFNYDALANTDDGSCIAVVNGCTDVTAFNYDALANTDDGSCIAVVNGCTDVTAFNYDALANTDDGSCIAVVNGCTDVTAFNYDALANTDDGSCIAVVNGCTDVTAFNYDALANTDDGSCIAVVNGCTDVTAFNYDALANTDDGSCIAVVNGCTDVTAFNYDALANTDDGSCIAVVNGCTDVTAFNYDALANTDDGSCIAVVNGCTDVTAFNYDALANTDDGSCIAVVNGCTDVTAFNYDALANTDDGSCIAVVNGCTDVTAFNYDALANTDDGSCIAVVNGCTDVTAFNYDALANTDDGSCIAVVNGCTDVTAFNYDALANTDDGSCIAVVNGCTDVTAFNYDALANTDDGSCIAVVNGCTDVTAFNYDALANTDDGSCIAVVNGCTDVTAFNYDALANTDDGSCIAVVNGCTDVTAFNYDALANTDDGSCIAVVNGCTDVTAFNYDALANTDDGSCIAVVNGCTDVTAFNYDALANTDDGSCIAVVNGCTDVTAFNYDALANTDDGSCIAVVNGCTDVTAFNYDALANTDDGSCIAVVNGCTDVTAFNYDALANTDDGSCIAVVNGCTDVTAFNYDALANTDDGSCIAVVNGCTDVTAFNYDALANTDDGSCIAVVNGCTDVTAFNYDALANTDDGSCIAVVNGCTDVTAFNYDALANTDDGSCVPFVYGCTDPNASNYNSAINSDDGSCIYLGCTDSTAFNYDATATVDDGSCSYTLILGCTDPNACNYDSTASVDDNSCYYPPVSLTNVIECDSYSWNGQTYTVSGTYNFVITNFNGCDSTATLNLTINPYTTSSSSATSCDDYNWNGQTYTASGTYTFATTNSNGCDSIATLNLTINLSLFSINNQAICFGSSYSINGNTYSSSGTYLDVYTNNLGCDSTVSTILTILPAFSVTTQNPTGGSPICLGESVTLTMTSWSPANSIYQWNNLSGAISGATSSTYTTSVAGTYSLTVTNPAGCTATSSGTNITTISLSAPTGLSASNIQLDRATMNWLAVTDADHYNIRMRVQGTSSWSIALNYLYGTSKEKLNLTSATSYEWEIQSVCSSDNSSVSAWSSTQSFATSTVCTTPTNTNTTAIGLTDATLGWDVSPGALEYIVRYKQVNQGWGTFTYITVTTNSLDLSSLSSGTAYHWQVKSACDANGNNNSAFSSFEVFNTGSCNASLNIIQTNVGCFGGSDGALDLSVSGGSGSFSYLWSDGSTSEDLTSLAAGTYSVTVTDNNTCQYTATYVITTPASAFSVTTQNPTGGSPICLGESVTLTMTSWSPANSIYQWNNLSGAISGATSSTYTTSVAGTYSLTVTNPAGCTATSSGTNITTISLSAPTGLSASNIQLDRATMNWLAVTDADHYNIRMRVQGTSSWSIALNYLYGTSKEKLNLTSATSYEWEIQSVCSSDNSSVSAWSSTQSFATSTVCTTPTNTNTTAIGLTDATLGWDVSPGALEYIVRYKQVNQGWGTFTYITVTTNSLDLSSLSSGTAYHWQVKSACDANGNNNSAFSSFEVFNTGSCNASLNIIQTNVGCFGGSDGALDLSVSGGSGSFSYLWSDGSTSEDLTSLAAGTYSVTVTDNNTCQYTATYVITTPASAFSVTTQNPTGGSPICLGESVTLTMTSWSPANSIYQWNNLSGAISGATSSTYTTSVAGTYSLTVTNPAGCTATSSGTNITTISLSAPTGLSASNIQLDRATMNWLAVTDADHYNIRMRVQGTSSWSIALNYLYGTSKEKLNLTSATSYEWEIQSVCSSDNSSVSAWSSTQSFATSTVCTTPTNTNTTAIGLTDATLGWDVSPGALEYIVRYKQVNQGWGTFTYITVTTNSLDLSSLSSGTAYHWQVKSACDANGNNNSAFSSFEVFNTGSCNASLNIIQTNVGCFGGSDGALDLSVSGGSGSFSYLWSDGSTSEDLTSLAAGTYSVTVTDNNTCQYTATYVITTPASAFSVTTQNPTGGSPICLGESVTLTMTSWSPANSIYQWNNLSGAISGATSSTYTTSVAGTYSLTVTNPAGCTATSSGTNITTISLSAPTGLSASNIQLDRATMNWLAVTDADHYNIRMRVQGTSSWSIALNYLYGTSKEKLNLTSATSYEWEIQSVCSSDNSSVSAWSSTQSFATSTVCTTPTNTNTTAIGLTDATLGWDVSPGALEYIVRYKQVNQGWGTFTYITVTTNSLDLSSLSSGTAYHWQVKSACDANGNNNSAFSSFEVFNTGSCNASLNIIQTNVGCFGGSDGALDLSVSGGSGSFSYLWSDGSTSEDLTSLAAGTYSVTVTDNNTCQYTATYVITTPASAFSVTTQNPTGGSPICLGESVTLTMTSWSPANSIYQWNNLSGAISGATSSTYTTSVAGTYSLTVTNPAGCTATSSGTNITTISLSAPTGLSASNIQLDRATMNWLAVTDADHYNIRMRVQGTSSWSIALNYLYGTSKEKLNLTSTTSYEWEIQSVCSSDNSSVSAWSSTQSFATLTVCTTPTNTNTTAIGLTDATLGWDVSPGALEYIVRYKQVNQGWGTFTYITVTTNSLDLSSLSSGTAYHWQVKSACDANGNNNSAFSSFVDFNTVNGCIPPTNIIIDSITTSSAVLSWDPNPVAFSYRLMYLVVGAPWNTRIDTTITPGLNDFTLSGLISNENYRFRIRTVCDPSVSYNSAWTGWDTLTTLAGIRIAAGDIELAENLNVYPNPTRGLFNVSFMAEKVDDFEIIIVDAFGKLVYQEDKQAFIGEYTKQIDLSDSPRGIYMLQIRTRYSFVSKRIVLQ